MGYGPVINGKQMPITPWEGSWAATVNNPDPERRARLQRAHQDQHAATHSGRLRLPGTYDRREALIVFDSIEEVDQNASLKLRQSAWEKLSPQERQALNMLERPTK